MVDTCHLICLRNPFDKLPLLLITDKTRYWHSRDVTTCQNYRNIYSFNFADTIDAFRDIDNVELPYIYDIELATKLIRGAPKSKFKKGSEPWTLNNILGKYIDRRFLQWLNEFQNFKILNPEEENDFSDTSTAILEGFLRAWEEVLTNLNEKGEEERYFSLETIVYNIFLKTQLQGIEISKSALESKLNSLKTDKYSAIKKLELNYHFLSQNITPQLQWKDIRNHITKNSIGEGFDTDFWGHVDLFAEHEEFLALLLQAHRSNKDYNALIKYTVDQNQLIFPTFDVLGTVTGRILITSPGIQYLRRTSRSIFIPKESFSHLYADFSQFEPGIVASFSKDSKLIEIYNSGDVYRTLSEVLFGSKDRRNIAKIIFLAFLYGMSEERLESFLARLVEENNLDSEVIERGMAFFEKFTTLKNWKNEQIALAKLTGYSSSILGNRRYIELQGQVSKKEARWIPNQIIQGTASYIFKMALIKLWQAEPNIGYLIPMHDAILLEVPIPKEDEIKNLVKEIFINQFKSVCPEIIPGVTFEAFHI